MIQIIEENRPKSTADRFGQAFGNLGQAAGKLIPEHFVNQQQQSQNQKAIEKLIGKDVSGLSPELLKDYVSQALKGQREEKLLGLKGQQEEKLLGLKGNLEERLLGMKGEHEEKLYGKKSAHERELAELKLQQDQKKFENKLIEHEEKAQQKLAPLQSALTTVAKMREIRERGNLGRGSGIVGFFGGETARDRGEYSQLGKSLISLSTSIPIRNRLEFETLAERLYDPSITDMEAEGVLNAMDHILSQGIEESGQEIKREVLKDYEELFADEEVPEMGLKKSSGNKKRPPLSSFQR